MVNCCVNPACRTELRLLSSGDLYAVERPHAQPEYFWLCSPCASRNVAWLDSAGRISVRPRSQTQPANPPNLRVSLRLVAHAVRRVPWRRAIPAGSRCMPEPLGSWGAPSHGAHR